MQSAGGNCCREDIWPARGTSAPEILERFPFWSPGPDVGSFRGLAHVDVRSFYRADSPKNEQIWADGALRETAPEAVRFVDKDGKEICCWPAADEYEELAPPAAKLLGHAAKRTPGVMDGD